MTRYALPNIKDRGGGGGRDVGREKKGVAKDNQNNFLEKAGKKPPLC